MKSEDLKSTIQALYQYDGRPDGVTSVDILLTIYLLFRGAAENPIRASDFTLGLTLAESPSTVQRSIRRLVHRHKWVSKTSGKGRGAANLYMVVLANLPVLQDLKRTVISPQMMTLAQQYAKAVRISPSGKRRRFTASNIQRFAFAFQQFLERYCGGDESLLRETLNFALSHPAHSASARRGPHLLRGTFCKLVAECKAARKPLVETQTPAAAA
jgi:hypothetical protein